MKSAFVLWSAGIDSTYLILRLLEKGLNVKSGYVNIQNNKRKTRMEKNAIYRMYTQIRHLFPRFEFIDTIYEGYNNSPDSRGLKYKQVPYFLHALLIAPKTDLRAIGYVAGDSAIKNLEKIRAVYDSYNLIYNGELPQLIFPLKTITKPEIFQDMKNRYPEILNNCVWCEHPLGTDFRPCGECTPCLRRNVEIRKTTLLSVS